MEEEEEEIKILIEDDFNARTEREEGGTKEEEKIGNQKIRR